MRTPAPTLLPIFRSDGQARLLARLYLEPDRPAPLAQLGRELEIDSAGLTREADRLEEAGLVRSERLGRQRLLHPNEDSPFYEELHGLLMKAFGPATAIGPALGVVDGVERAVIFGSWAARYEGVRGQAPADIDVMVIGRPARSDVTRVTRELTELLGREVNATIVSVERFDGDGDGFIRQAKSGALLELDLGHDT